MRALKLILTLLMIAALIVPVSASDQRLVDEADLLSQDEELMLEAMLDLASEQWMCDTVIVTVDSLEGKSAEAYADDYYDENGYGYGSDYTGILFLVAMDEREWAFSTCGDAIRIFTDACLGMIEDEVIYYLSDGDYYGGFNAFVDVCNTVLERASMGEIYDDYGGYVGYEEYSELDPVSTVIMWLPISLIIGFIISLIVVNIMKGEMNTVHSAVGASSFERKDRFAVTTRQDIYLYRNVSRTPRQTEQSRGGGSTVHHSSSGRSHGGRSGRF